MITGCNETPGHHPGDEFWHGTGWLVFVDQAAKDGSAFDPFRWGIGDRVVGLGWVEVERAVRASSVVVPRVLGQDSAQVPFTEDQHPVGHFRSDREHEPLRVGIRAGTLGWNLHRGDAGIGQDRIECCGELPGPVADQKPELCGAIAEIHQKIPDLLHGPGPVGVRGHADDVGVSGADLHHEEDVDPLEGHCAVHVEEVAGQHRRCLGAQELAPRGVRLPLWCWRDPQGREDPADRRGADPVAEREQFTLDPLVSPGAVLRCEAFD
jgi:hypothetical protein